MQITLQSQLTRFNHLLQQQLFPMVEEELGKLSETAKRVVQVLAMIPLRRFVPVAAVERRIRSETCSRPWRSESQRSSCIQSAGTDG
jgi:hypothetical protein